MMTNVSSGCCPFSGQSLNTPVTEEAKGDAAYNDLYNCFVQKTDTSDNPTDPSSIPSRLHKLSAEGDINDFIVIGSTQMMVHCKNAEEQYQKIPFRKSAVPGFPQLTSISHIVPTLSYLSEGLENLGDDSDETIVTIDDFKNNLSTLYNLPFEEKFAWLRSTDTPKAYYTRRDSIEAMINFALKDALNFFEVHPKKDDKYSFTTEDVINYFGLQNTYEEATRHQSLWKGIMVGTFSLIVLDTISNLTTNYGDVLSKIDWDNVEVISAGMIGAASSGLDITTNSTYKCIAGLAAHYGNGLNTSNVYFAPYAMEPDWTKEAKDLYDEFSVVYNNLKDRVDTSGNMFTQMKTGIKSLTSIRKAIDQMYASKYEMSIETAISLPDITGENTDPDIYKRNMVDALTRRMAFCMMDYRDTLSDCVAAKVLEDWMNATPNDDATSKIENTYLFGLDFNYDV